MRDDLTHASFFSGAGGLDLGLERAGWRTVSFSEIDPYASAVLAQRWPGVPNLGDIVSLARRDRDAGADGPGRGGDGGPYPAWATADLWTGGFPCQDLSVAGKRRGMGEGTRSGLAYTYLDLVGRHRPRFVLLENVPGLLSSHGGRDMAALLGALVELGYGVGYRMLDARYFGVPQRRRRVFILGDALGGSAGAERAAEVLSVGSRCRWHPPTGIEAGPRTSGVVADGATTARTVQSAFGHHGWTLGAQDVDGGYFQLAPTIRVGASGPGSGGSGHALPLAIGSSPNARRDGATDGLAGRSYDREDVGSYHQRDRVYADIAPALDAYGDTPSDAPIVWSGSGVADSDLLPIGLDSHRYRCCGNGVVSNVSEWIGSALREALEAEEMAA